MTASQAIETSIRETRIVHLALDRQADEELRAESDDWTDANGTRDYWGTTADGEYWRVQMRLSPEES
jgi:hypothetical protein